MARDKFNITMDPYNFGNLIAQDPQAYERLHAGIQDAMNGKLVPLTTPLGASNVNGGQGDEALWCTLFASTDRDVKPGNPGLFYHTKDKETGAFAGRIWMTLRRQTKRQQTAVTPGAQLQDVTQDELNKALAFIRAQNEAAGETQAQVEVPAEPDLGSAANGL